jgi:hypothetical protein
MSQVAPRAIALQEANKLGLTDADSVLAAANAFVYFILAGELPASSQGLVPPSPPTSPPPPTVSKKAPAPAPKAAKPAAPKAATKPVEPEPETYSETETTVGSVVDRLLVAQKRDEAVKLLKDFGATSVSGVKAAKAADFIAQGLAILTGEADADLTE